MTPQRPLVLLVLDGWGINENREHNAIALARTPVYDALLARYPHARLVASGEAVGLPAGQMGNSEVGHTNMGAGRVVYQDLTRINKSITDGELFRNAVAAAAMDRCAGGARALHLVGLLSDGGVHSHQQHLHAFLQMAAGRGVSRVFVHAIMDGRDTSPTGGTGYLGELERAMAASTGRIASIIGRYYAMDRDKRWDRTKLAYDLLVSGRAESSTTEPVEALQGSYEAGATDEFVRPIVVTDANGDPIGPIRDGDSVVYYNFRADRARQLTRALALDDAEFDGFERPGRPGVHYTTMTVYDRTFTFPVIFTPQTFSGNLADVLASHGRSNLRLAETEKYAHVTYFFNCGNEEPYPGEDRLLVPSQRVATYDLMPEMSAAGIADQLVADLHGRRHQVVICNFANADMVGHSGDLDATIAAVETLDACLGRIITALNQVDGTAIVTSDHGNAEQMWDEALKSPHTAHTSNPVPVLLCDESRVERRLRNGSLRDVAPTMLDLLGLPAAPEMTGSSLIAE
ncbi:MAG: 2,3-bisphosphoglycerate-independent phosphoglycerate mutase [Acidobacteria bacterium]|nr:2,3-bisphosphoglycerate-independent phosphoglycerate mutase [Acidobacteriota bacterium]